jgi:iron complex outermembrane receptor protein
MREIKGSLRFRRLCLTASASWVLLAASVAGAQPAATESVQSSAEGATAAQPSAAAPPNQTTPPTDVGGTAAASALAANTGDIVVTAQRRAESLQKTPLAISYFGGEQLQNSNTKTLRDLAGLAPNVQIPRFGATPTTQQIYIRGIGEGDLIYNPKVPIYIDDFFVPGSVNSLSDLTDVDHIEVLRGPQGTLYGQNSSAGAIRVITLRPGDEFKLMADAGYGNYDAKQAHLYVSVPLQEGLAASVTASHTEHDGFVYNPTLDKRVNNLDVTTLRGKLRYFANPDLDIELAGDYTWDNSGTRQYSSAFQPGGFNPKRSYSGVDPRNDSNAFGVSSRISYKLSDNLTARSLSSYRGFYQLGDYDNQGTPAVPFNGVAGAALGFNSANFVRYKNRSFTQEFQLNGDYDDFSFATGLFYYHSKLHFRRNFYNNFGVGNLPRRQFGIQTEDSYAAYGQLTYHLTSRLNATAGVRVGHQKVNGLYSLSLLDVNRNVTSVLFQTDTDASFTRVTPKVGLDFQVNPDVLLYASVSRGLNGGGFDTRAGNPTDSATPFKPEIVTTYEGGIKTTFLNRAVRVNLTGFYNQFKDFQAGAFVAATGGQIRGNAGKAHTWGVELETTLRPVNGFEISGNLGYLYAVFDEYLNPVGPNTSASGNRLPRAPRWTSSLGATYELPLGTTGLKFGGNMNYQSKSFVDVTNTLNQLSPAVTLYDAFTTLTLPGDRWSITGSIRNITDKQVTTSGSNTQFTSIHTYNDPRTYFLSVKFKY